jgi:hypothetical protein
MLCKIKNKLYFKSEVSVIIICNCCSCSKTLFFSRTTLSQTNWEDFYALKSVEKGPEKQATWLYEEMALFHFLFH